MHVPALWLRTLTLIGLCAPPLAALGSQGALEQPPKIELTGARASFSQSVGLSERDAGHWFGGGTDYRARFDERGLRFEPALGRAALRTQHLALELESITRGGVEVELHAASALSARGATGLAYERAPGIEERHDLTPAGVELSYAFEHELGESGELVVRLALDTSLPQPALGEARELLFARPDTGGVSIGAVTGIDALGQTAEGSLRLVPGALELVLPAHFVDAADWPLVLDPLVATSFGISTTASNDARPDAAYGSPIDLYLVVWQRIFSAADSDIRGQYVNATTGALHGSTIFFTSAGVAENPTVASVHTVSQFLVAWQQFDSSGLYSIRCESLRAGNTLTADGAILVSNVQPLTNPDLGGDGTKHIGATSGAALLVYDSAGTDDIRGKRVLVEFSGAISTEPSFPIVADAPQLFTFVSNPRIASSCGVYGRFLMVYQRSGPLLASPTTIRGVILNVNGTVQTSTFLVASDSDADLIDPAVDGFDRLWTVAWERDHESDASHVEVCSVRHNVSANDWTVGASVDVTPGLVLGSAKRAAVGYSAGKSFIAWREQTLLGSVIYKLRGFDAQTCVPCEGPISIDNSTTTEDEQWIALATPTTGGAYYDDRGIFLWSDTASATNHDLHGYLFKNAAGTGGALQNLGGACGSGGTPTFSNSQAPSIGTSWYIFGLTGLPLDAPVAVLNVSTGAVPLNCGPCVWNPFQITSSSLVVGGATSQARLIPCDPDLIGLQFQTQWTSLTPTSSGCNLFPGFSISDRTRVTIGT